jgi:HD-GYP domain-containing protein (c-di-GMP phosphodiesterase class II)
MAFVFSDSFESHTGFSEKLFYFFNLFLALSLCCLAAVTVLFPFHFKLPVFLLWVMLAWMGHRQKFVLKHKKTSFHLNFSQPIYLAAFFLYGISFALWIFIISGMIHILTERRGIKRFALEAGTAVFISTLLYSFPFFRAPFLHKIPLAQNFFYIFLFQAIYASLQIAVYSLFKGIQSNIRAPKNESSQKFYSYAAKAAADKLLLQPFLCYLILLTSFWHELLILSLLLIVSDFIFTLEEQSHLGSGLEQTAQILSRALSTKDGCTERHTERVKRYARLIAKGMGLSHQEIEKIEWAAKLHDIGKLFVKDEVLKKTSSLTQNEYEHIKLHVQLDHLLDPLFKINNPIAEYIHVGRLHHERYDGKGYPFGLKGEEIPMAARIISVADAWDAMISTRPYKKPFQDEAALEILKQGAGTQWDPEVVFVFHHLYESSEMSHIRNEYQNWKAAETKTTLKQFQRLLAFEA